MYNSTLNAILSNLNLMVVRSAVWSGFLSDEVRKKRVIAQSDMSMTR